MATTDRQYELIGVFPNRAAADLALAALKDAGFDRSRLSAAIHDEHEERPHHTGRTDVDAALDQLHQVEEGAPEERVSVIVISQGHDAEALAIMKLNGARDIRKTSGQTASENSENGPISRDPQPMNVNDVNVDTPYSPPRPEQTSASGGTVGAGAATDSSVTGVANGSTIDSMDAPRPHTNAESIRREESTDQ